MGYIIYSAICYLIISIGFLIVIVKKNDSLNATSYYCLYHALTVSFVASNSANKEITSDNFGIILPLLYTIIGIIFYGTCWVIQEKKKKEEK